jgi:hypothetical protein
MKERTKSIFVHLFLTIAGVAVGTLISGIVSSDKFKLNDSFGAIILSPLEMTLGIPMIFYRISTVVGILAVFGFIIWICSIALRIKNKRLANHTTWIGAAFWSLGNIPVFWAYMSV